MVQKKPKQNMKKTNLLLFYYFVESGIKSPKTQLKQFFFFFYQQPFQRFSSNTTTSPTAFWNGAETFHRRNCAMISSFLIRKCVEMASDQKVNTMAGNMREPKKRKRTRKVRRRVLELISLRKKINQNGIKIMKKITIPLHTSQCNFGCFCCRRWMPVLLKRSL